MNDRKYRIKPYIPIDDANLLEEISRSTGLSIGAVLMKMLYESSSFIACKISFQKGDRSLKEAFYRPDIFLEE